MNNFEVELLELIDRWRERGTPADEILGALELRCMALKEEQDGDE